MYPKKIYIEKYTLASIDKDLIKILLNTMYPQNSLFITTINTSPKILFKQYLSDSKWSIISSGKIVMSSDNYSSSGEASNDDNSLDIIKKCILSASQVPQHTHKITLLNDKITQMHNHTFKEYIDDMNLDADEDESKAYDAYSINYNNAKKNVNKEQTTSSAPSNRSHSHPMFITKPPVYPDNILNQMKQVEGNKISTSNLIFYKDNIMIDCNTTISSDYTSIIIQLDDVYYVIMIKYKSMFNKLDTASDISQITINKDGVTFIIYGYTSDLSDKSLKSRTYKFYGSFSDSYTTTASVEVSDEDNNNVISTKKENVTAYLYNFDPSSQINGHTHKFSDSQIPKFYVKIWKRNDSTNTNTNNITINEQSDWITYVLEKIFPTGSIIIALDDINASNYNGITKYISNWKSISGDFIPISKNSNFSINNPTIYTENKTDKNGDSNGSLSYTCGHVLQESEIPSHQHDSGVVGNSYYHHTHNIDVIGEKTESINLNKNSSGVDERGYDDDDNKDYSIDSAYSANHEHETIVTYYGVDEPDSHNHKLNIPSYKVKIYYRTASSNNDSENTDETK